MVVQAGDAHAAFVRENAVQSEVMKIQDESYISPLSVMIIVAFLHLMATG